MKVISIHAPWAWAIIYGHKRFENRTWKTLHRGPIGIHASQPRSSDNMALKTILAAGIQPPTIAELDGLRGKIIGSVDLIDVIELANASAETKADPFTIGPICFVLANPVVWVRPVLAKGNLRVWNYSPGGHAGRFDFSWTTKIPRLLCRCSSPLPACGRNSRCRCHRSFDGNSDFE